MSAPESSYRTVLPQTRLKVSKYSLLANLYFFFNSILLPKGLLYTLILSPWFYLNLVVQKKKTWLVPFAVFLLLFNLVHFVNGVQLKSFLLSNAMFVCVYFFVASLWHFVSGFQHLGRIFREVLVFNAMMVIAALLLLLFAPEMRHWLWYTNRLTPGLDNFPRLALITYEASYYSLLMTPVFVYFILKFLFGQIGYYKWGTLALAAVPLLMSLSFGVIGALFITALVMCAVFWRRVLKRKKPVIIVVVCALFSLCVLIFLALYYPDNALFIRMRNIFAGHDTSFRGRTTESFDIAWRLAEDKSLLFGVGLGQVKVVIVDVIRKYYNYWGILPRYDIPNAMAETLAIFGLAGVALRIGLQVWLFFRTRVFSNYYRLALFIFVFMYQFTGSFITNVAEYAIWVLAFSPVFPAFDRNPAARADFQAA